MPIAHHSVGDRLTDMPLGTRNTRLEKRLSPMIRYRFPRRLQPHLPVAGQWTAPLLELQ